MPGDPARPRATRHVATGILTYSADILATVFAVLKLPIALLLAPTILLFICLAASNAFIHVVQANTSSLCSIPAVARLVPICPMASETPAPPALVDRANFPALVKVQSVVLEQLLDTSAGGLELSLNVKHAELAVKDLVALVLESNVTIKDILADALINVALDARTTGRKLQRLSEQINSVFDSIGSYNAYALQSIAAAKRSHTADVDAAVASTFQVSMTAFSSQITRVIVDASATMAALDALETRLYEVHELCVRESVATNAALEDVLWELWTILGGNQARVRDLRHRATMLKEVEHYRAVAVAYVAATTHTLQTIDGGLSALRDKLSEYVPGPHSIPAEVHIASIEYSVTRMQAMTHGGHRAIVAAIDR